ncbi:hypothetical protein [Pelagibius marinus]|uniref:hypothetical protein n=1 Tax=Pelagibius marinus TaxID=2762760 RepID=UPI0018729BCA|nr:hypothetical protein [Pelagibius marinus]
MPNDRKSLPNSGPDSGPESPARAPDSGAKGADSRQERLARALRDNLRKRKAQQRQRQEGGA